MTISVFPPKRSIPRFDTPFALQQDNWNDYSFQTLYYLYYSGSPAGSTPTEIGPVKILRRGQSASDGLQINQHFERLGRNFCSVGVSLDYYQHLNEIPPKERKQILSALRDVVAYPQLQDAFHDEPGWLISLFRENSDPNSFLAEARAIPTGNFSALPDLGLSLSFRPTNWKSPLVFDFDAPQPWHYVGKHRRVGPSQIETLLPRRIVVVIGRNGSGKSTLLSRIARVAYSSSLARLDSNVLAIGSFEPPSVSFTRIIAISYSAFDNFIVPGLYETERRQIASDVENGRGRYIYAGLRDIVAEVRDDLAEAESRQLPDNERAFLIAQDRRKSTRLKSLEQLANEFDRLIRQIEKNGDNRLLDAALEPLLVDPSFADFTGRDRSELLGSSPRDSFLDWGTGHKIALHVVASLVAHATRKSLVLFDEPEMHLHPPLTAALMRAIRVILEEKNAFALVATHSPVVLQETLARHVRIIRRSGSNFDVLAPSLETFGENVGTLTYDAFGLTAASTDFHHALDLLVGAFNTVEEINALFTPALSGQALAYVMSGLARKLKSQ